MKRSAVLFALAVGSVLASTSGARASGAGAPSGFDLLERVRAVYGDLKTYSDRGSISIDRAERWRFETAYDADTGFLLRLDDAGTGERDALFWGSEAGEFRYDAADGRGEPVEHLLSSVLARVGSGGRFGLVPAALLLQGAAALPEPEAMSVDGPLSCAEAHEGLAEAGACYIVSGGAIGGTVLFELWVSAEDARVLYADVEAIGAPEIARRGGAPERRMSVLYESARLDPPRVDVSPRPEEARRSFEGAAGETRGAAGGRPDRFGETIEVRLTSLRLRALDPSGTPIEDLEPEDLRLRVDGEEIPVEAVEWVESASPKIDLPPEVLAREGIVVAAPGKLVIFFVQADLEPSRAYGQMRMMPRIRELIDTLGRDDWMAVVSYDSHLKLRHDFSRDADSVHEAIKNAIIYSDAERLEPRRFPSLARYLDYDEARDVAQPEDALELTARALQRLPGEKIMVFLGFGLGRYGGDGVRLNNSYDRAAERLALARVTVFTLDVTQADAHSLEVGLRQVSADTGGAFYRTFRFPDVAVRQVARAIAGHWVVYFHEPAATAERERKPKVRVELHGRKGRVLLAPRG